MDKDNWGSQDDVQKGFNADSYFQLAIQFAQNGKSPEAISAFKKAVALNPDVPNYHGHLAWQYFVTNQFENAIKEYQLLIQLEPQNAEAYFRLGDCFRALNQLPDAEIA